jgi:hypothetical protein
VFGLHSKEETVEKQKGNGPSWARQLNGKAQGTAKVVSDQRLWAILGDEAARRTQLGQERSVF